MRNDDDVQSLFILKGDASGAELIRNCSSFDLYYYNFSHSTHYHIGGNSSSIHFEWPMIINSREMKLVNGVNITSKHPEFHTFAVVDSQTGDVQPTQRVLQIAEYYYVIGAVILVLLIESPAAYLHYRSNRRDETTESQSESSVDSFV